MGNSKYLKYLLCNKILQHPQFIECCIDDCYYVLKIIEKYSTKPDFVILYIIKQMQLSKPSSKLQKFITILRKGLSYKCYNERMSKKIAYSFLMTSIPCTDLHINNTC